MSAMHADPPHARAQSPADTRVRRLRQIPLRPLRLRRVKSERLSDFLEALCDEQLSRWTKFRVCVGVWRRKRE